MQIINFMNLYNCLKLTFIFGCNKHYKMYILLLNHSNININRKIYLINLFLYTFSLNTK